LKTDHASKAGLTLVEVLVALALFTLGMAGFFALSNQIRHVLTVSSGFSEATQLAASRVEEFRNGDITSIASGMTTVDTYEVAWTVATNLGCDARNVRLTVSWSDYSGMSHETVVKTIIEP